MDDIKATATLVIGGEKIKGRLSTAHAASSYGQPVFVDDDGQAYNWADIASIDTAATIGRIGGQSTSEAKRAAARANGRRGGRPKKPEEGGQNE